MRISVCNLKRDRLFDVTVDEAHPPTMVRPPGEEGSDVYLMWDRALDDQGHLRRCPVCGCRELFSRKDFPQVTGFAVVVLAAVLAMVMFGMRQVWMGLAVLAAVVLIDAVIFLFAGRCLVCYRCRSEFRDIPIGKDHRGWELATGEKYRTGRG